MATMTDAAAATAERIVAGVVRYQHRLTHALELRTAGELRAIMARADEAGRDWYSLAHHGVCPAPVDAELVSARLAVAAMVAQTIIVRRQTA